MPQRITENILRLHALQGSDSAPVQHLRRWASRHFLRHALLRRPLLSIAHAATAPIGFYFLWDWSGFFGNFFGLILQIGVIICTGGAITMLVEHTNDSGLRLRYLANLRQSLARRDPLYRIIQEVLAAHRLLQHAVTQYHRWSRMHEAGLSTDLGTSERFAVVFSTHVPTLERTVNQCLVLCSIRDDTRYDTRVHDDDAFSLAGLHSDAAAELQRIAGETRLSPQRALEDIERSVSAFRTLERELQVLASPHRS